MLIVCIVNSGTAPCENIPILRFVAEIAGPRFFLYFAWLHILAASPGQLPFCGSERDICKPQCPRIPVENGLRSLALFCLLRQRCGHTGMTFQAGLAIACQWSLSDPQACETCLTAGPFSMVWQLRLFTAVRRCRRTGGGAGNIALYPNKKDFRSSDRKSSHHPTRVSIKRLSPSFSDS